jgi:hypothetical protein
VGADDQVVDAEELVLSDLLNRVLDRGVVIAGEITISVANIDLIRVGLNVYIAAIETELQKSAERARSRPPLFNDAHLPVLRPPGHR